MIAPTIQRRAKPYTVKTVTETTVDFDPVVVVTGRTIQAKIYPASPEQLRSESIDWSLEYIQIHSLGVVTVGEYVEYLGEDFKVISSQRYEEFSVLIGEQTKKALLVIT